MLLECLQEAEERSRGNKEKRLAAAISTEAWGLMQEEWQGLLFNLLKYDLENDASSPNKGKRRIGRRGGRGGRALMQQFDMQSIDSLIIGNDNYDYRLSTLLTHKIILGDEWSNDWNQNLNLLRSKCKTDGVHPVFHSLSSTFKSILGEMDMYDVIKIEINEDLSWLDKCRIDPSDSEMLVDLLKPPIGINLKGSTLGPLKKLYDQMQRKGKIKQQWLAKQLDARLLSEKTGKVGLLAAILSASAGIDGAKERFESLSTEDGVIGKIAKQQLLLINIREVDGDDDGYSKLYKECISLKNDNSLSDACRVEALMKIPGDVSKVSLKDLELGLKEVTEWGKLRGVEINDSLLRWRIIEAMRDAGRVEELEPYFSNLDITNDQQLVIALSLLDTNIYDLVITKLEEIIESSIDLDLSVILSCELIPMNIRLTVSELLGFSGSADGDTEEMMMELYTKEGDIHALATLISSRENGAQIHPHMTLVAARLIGAESNSVLLEWIDNARRESFSIISDVDLPSYLSPAAFALTSLLDGGETNLQEITSITDASIPGFKQCRRAMMEDGDGLVPQQLLNEMDESFSSSDIGAIENMLFKQLILNLKLNRADSLLQRAEQESHAKAEEIIEDVLTNTPPTYRLMKNVNAQVLEHGVASVALDKWYKNYNSHTVEASIATGRLYEKKGNRLQAARAYHAAAIRCDDFELRQKLNKEALISFAHAGNWPEAIELLESESGLKANITDKFKLYLKVNDEANRDNLEIARDLILDDVVMTKIVEKKNSDGESCAVEVTDYSIEDLNLHLTYPSSHRLPEEPFRGRVLASINWVLKGHNRKGGELESAFQHALNRKRLPEISNIANRANEERGPEHGLLFYERAMNSGKFDTADLQRLSIMQRNMFSRTEINIPIRNRIHLRNLSLKPLVIIDTNLLVDALAEKILHQLKVERDIPMHLDNRREFHKTLLYRLQQGRIDICVHETVRRELKDICERNPKRIRNICGDRLVNPKLWDDKINKKVLLKLANETIKEFNSWNSSEKIGLKKLVQKRIADLEDFFVDLHDVFSDITDAKIKRGSKTTRHSINGEEIYPEFGDIEIMIFSTDIAEQCLEGFGSVLIASRDSDFTYPARALQERLGFIIVDNAQALSHYTN